jgi:hypothetical protein
MSGRVRRRADVLWRRSIDAVLVLPPGMRDPVTLSGTGPVVWDAIEDVIPLDELTRALSAEFGADPDVVRADLGILLDRLVGLGVVERTTV